MYVRELRRKASWGMLLRFSWGWVLHAAAAESLQSCLTLCDPIDGSPPGSPVPGILQARTLEWVAISFSNAWKWKVKGKLLNPVWLLATPHGGPFQVVLFSSSLQPTLSPQPWAGSSERIYLIHPLHSPDTQGFSVSRGYSRLVT